MLFAFASNIHDITLHFNSLISSVWNYSEINCKITLPVNFTISHSIASLYTVVYFTNHFSTLSFVG